MKILIVEDEPKVASFIKKGLEESHFEADLAYDGISAEKLARQYKYNLFILDIIIQVQTVSNFAKSSSLFIRASPC
jgi:DNA-binding response OmpR family regulator